MPSESRSTDPTCFDLPAKPEADSDNNSSRQESRTEKLHRFKLASLIIDSLLKHIDEFRIFTDQGRPNIVSLNETKLDQPISDSLL